MATTLISSRPKRLDYLDSIRALAAIGVVYLHGALEFRPIAHGWDAKLITFFTEVIDPGKIGVLVFFMVSGFIIPSSFRFNRPKGISVRDFLLGRLFRLYPAYWLSMIAAFFLIFHGSLFLCSVKRILMNATMFQQFMASQQINLLGVYWTLQIEWSFYILCLAMFLLGWLNRPKHILGAYLFFSTASLAMAAVRYRTHRALPLAATLGLSMMFAANLWRMFVHDRRPEAARPLRIAFGSFAILLIPICMMAYSFDVGYGKRWTRYLLVYWLAMVLFTMLTTLVKIEWRPLVLVGRASYSLYLFADIFHILYEKLLPPNHYARASANLYLVGLVLVACVCSLPIYEYIEKPMVSLGKKLTRRLEYPDKAAIDPVAANSM